MAKEVISTFKEKPKTAIAWKAMRLGLSTLLIPPLLGIFAGVVRPALDRFFPSNGDTDTFGMVFGFAVGLSAVALSIYALVTGIRAYRKGERSWVLWVGFIPAMLIGCFWVFMIAGEFLFPH